jgi:hypothetical protein
LAAAATTTAAKQDGQRNETNYLRKQPTLHAFSNFKVIVTRKIWEGFSL